MKKTILRLITFFMPLVLMTACLFEEEDIFDKSAALRMDEEIKADIALLTGAQNGWLVDYYPEKDYSMGGYAMHWKFLPDGTVSIACEVTVNGVPARQVSNSFWDVKPEQAPVLSFDTYNAVLQYFCQPSQSDIDGLAGDYEFIIRRNVDMDGSLVITGKRNGNRLIVRPVATNENPIDYLAQVKDFESSVATSRNFDFYVNGNVMGTTHFGSSVKAGLKVRSIDVEVAVPSGGEGEESTQDTTVFYTFTPNGFRFNEPVVLGGVSVQNFVWNADERKYTSTESAAVEWVCTDAPPKYNYNAFLGDFTLRYGGAGLATDATVYSTFDVTIEADVPGESYIIKGLLLPEFEEEYPIHLRYDPAVGLVVDAQKIGMSGNDEAWLAISFWNGTGTFVRGIPAYSSLKSANFVEVETGDPYGAGYSFTLSDNSNGAYPSQPSYFAYGISFRTFTPVPTASSNGTAFLIGMCADKYRCYNISMTKK